MYFPETCMRTSFSFSAQTSMEKYMGKSVPLVSVATTEMASIVNATLNKPRMAKVYFDKIGLYVSSYNS